eukprot:TRINITY_DN3034_c0_g1_i2.p2 TRINITY_DN3034_c0_g1~~TRINITY_DN3034_c0_g1_i2.p2  ORF type:complete len:263 (+),score=77.86 TRINITY_DN3034_c0_g1_i2:1052-1840(+)
MIANISPSAYSYDDIYNTLKYASRAKHITVEVSQNRQRTSDHLSQYTTIIAEQKKQIKELNEKLEQYERLLKLEQNDRARNVSSSQQEDLIMNMFELLKQQQDVLKTNHLLTDNMSSRYDSFENSWENSTFDEYEIEEIPPKKALMNSPNIHTPGRPGTSMFSKRPRTPRLVTKTPCSPHLLTPVSTQKYVVENLLDKNKHCQKIGLDTLRKNFKELSSMYLSGIGSPQKLLLNDQPIKKPPRKEESKGLFVRFNEKDGEIF